MSITGTLFLFCFLPLSLILYYFCQNKLREYILLALSLCFYALGSVKYIFLFLCSIILSIIIGRLIHLTPKKLARRILLITGIALNAGILIYYKYADFILSFTKENAADVQKEVLLPLGLSFFTFKAISYLVDVYSGKAVLSENPVHDALYLSFFGQIQSGPLSRYNDMCFPAELDGKKNARMNLFSDGVLRFLIGFNKKGASGEYSRKGHYRSFFYPR